MRNKKVYISDSEKCILHSFLFISEPEDLDDLYLMFSHEYYCGYAYSLYYGRNRLDFIRWLPNRDIRLIENYISDHHGDKEGRGMAIYYGMLQLVISMLIKYQTCKGDKKSAVFIKGKLGKSIIEKCNSYQLFLHGFLLRRFPECTEELELYDCFLYYYRLCNGVLADGKLSKILEELTNEQKKTIEEYIEKHKDEEKGIDLAEYYLVLKTVIEILKTYYKEDCV